MCSLARVIFISFSLSRFFLTRFVPRASFIFVSLPPSTLTMDRAHVRVCILSLRQNEARWPALEMRVRKFGFANVEVVEGVLGRALDDAQVQKVLSPAAYAALTKPDRAHHYELSGPGSLGCALSHATMWRKQIDTVTPFMLVLEEDALFDEHDEFIRDYDRAMTDLSDPHLNLAWDVAYLGFWPHVGDVREDSASPMWHKIPDRQAILGTHAYLLSLSGARLLLEHFLPIEMQVDTYMSRAGERWGLRRLALRRAIVHQRLRIAAQALHTKPLSFWDNLFQPQFMDPIALAHVAQLQYKQEGWSF
jgi:GR25 family glycosyltransferase involved in LPS biosynthesis